jgi:hypothetical protein
VALREIKISCYHRKFFEAEWKLPCLMEMLIMGTINLVVMDGKEKVIFIKKID